MDAAEKRVRGAGFSAMSFRDVANDVGIKSASVHYHFPTKADLGEALVERYAARFKDALDAIATEDLRIALDSFVALYANALVPSEAICLCAAMGAESIGLPENINTKTKAFFQLNQMWLEALLSKHGVNHPAETAYLIVAALQGGMIVASTSNDRIIFNQVAKAAVRSATQK